MLKMAQKLKNTRTMLDIRPLCKYSPENHGFYPYKLTSLNARGY